MLHCQYIRTFSSADHILGPIQIYHKFCLYYDKNAGT